MLEQLENALRYMESDDFDGEKSREARVEGILGWTGTYAFNLRRV